MQGGRPSRVGFWQRIDFGKFYFIQLSCVVSSRLTSDSGVYSGVHMEPKRFVTDGASRDIRVYTRNLLQATAARNGDTLDTFVVRLENECYACTLHSRRSNNGGCNYRCNSSVSNYGVNNNDIVNFS